MSDTEDERTFKIVRFYANNNRPSEVVETGLTLDQAKKHCKDPNTSSRTATAEWAKAITAVKGDWFDGFEEE